MRFDLDRLVSYHDDALLAELRRVGTLIAPSLMTQVAFDKHSKASASLVSRRFGSWKEALARAGLRDRYGGGTGARGRKAVTFSDEDLLAELRTIAQKLEGKPVTIDGFNEHARMNAETVRRRFGSWWEALKRAGLPIANLGKRYSDDDYFENLLAVWTHHGRQPKYREMLDVPSRIPPKAYEEKWGGWTKALQSFLERVNSDSHAQAPNRPAVVPVEEVKSRTLPRRRARIHQPKEDLRKIRIGLRYEVLMRDRFRCVLCGASPATHLGCVLHVDHVIPWSKGGKTRAGNLRAVCGPCNLGKGAKLEDF